MGIDYYHNLGLTRSATDTDIKKAFRKLALKGHPHKNPDDTNALDHFRAICEAYEVLVDARKRATYDQYGEDGLKKGVPEGRDTSGAWASGYDYHGDAHKTFREFFGGDNPFQEFYDRVDADMVMSFGGIQGRGRKKQDPAVERFLEVSLEEAFHGCVKKMKISRRVLNDDGHTTAMRDKILSITVKRGWKPGTRVTFPEEGDQGPNSVPANVVFIIKDRAHPRFRRDEENLIFTARISLLQALTNTVVEVITLDDRIINIPINDIVYPGYTKLVPGEGMPFVTEPNKKGDLIIEFIIDFPNNLTPNQKNQLKSIFQH